MRQSVALEMSGLAHREVFPQSALVMLLGGAAIHWKQPPAAPTCRAGAHSTASNSALARSILKAEELNEKNEGGTED